MILVLGQCGKWMKVFQAEETGPWVLSPSRILPIWGLPRMVCQIHLKLIPQTPGCPGTHSSKSSWIHCVVVNLVIGWQQDVLITAMERIFILNPTCNVPDAPGQTLIYMEITVISVNKRVAKNTSIISAEVFLGKQRLCTFHHVTSTWT